MWRLRPELGEAAEALSRIVQEQSIIPVREHEAARIRIAHINGCEPCSETRINEMERWDLEARDVTFAIGGADALPADVLAQAERVWSLSPLTLPHELARVIVYEQLYRAHTIRRGEPYHRGT